MSEKSFDLSAVLPIFNGGELFMDAILSIENSQIPFKNVFISFNGESDFDYQKFITAKSKNEFKNSYTIFQTGKNLDALDHGLFLQGKLKTILNNDSIVFLLAHDDRILSLKLDSFIDFLEQNDCRSTIFFPSYHCCLARNYEKVLKVIEQDECMSSEHFFFRSLHNNMATNMSGMILPFHAFKASFNASYKMGCRGARFEHITCISPGIKHVYFHNKLSMLIGERENSEGKMLSYRDHRVAAFNYIWSFFKNRQLKTLTKAPTYLYYLAKNWAGYMLYK